MNKHSGHFNLYFYGSARRLCKSEVITEGKCAFTKFNGLLIGKVIILFIVVTFSLDCELLGEN